MEIKKGINNAAVSTTKFVFGGIHMATSSIGLMAQVAEANIINRLDGQDKEQIMKERGDKTCEKIHKSITMYNDFSDKLRSTIKRKPKTQTA